MKNLLIGNTEYEELLKRYSLKDGIKALVLFTCSMLLTVMLGFSFLTNISSEILTSFQVLINFIEIIICLIFLWVSKESLKTIGFTIANLKKSIGMGIIGAFLLVFILIVNGLIKGTLQFNHLMELPSVIVILTFIGCAIGEEVVFRGYIQTRILGIIKNRLVGTIICSILFLIIHYPVKWCAWGSISFTVIPLFYVICLLLLHFLCDFVYKKTNCLWGAIVLHCLYNILQAMLVIG